jgi:hypothetical protein
VSNKKRKGMSTLYIGVESSIWPACAVGSLQSCRLGLPRFSFSVIIMVGTLMHSESTATACEAGNSNYKLHACEEKRERLLLCDFYYLRPDRGTSDE